MLFPSLFLLVAVPMASCSDVPNIKFNDGKEMPAIALGTYMGFDKNGIIKSENNMLRDAIIDAIDKGYRVFDTATVYGTENEIGQAIRMKIDSGELKREDVFIVTKLWNTHHQRGQVAQALRESLRNLGLNHVDLYLMHWPMGLNEDYSHSDVDFMETWRGMEDTVKLGLAKSIGLSNFNQKQIERVMEESLVKPVALQIEIQPQLIQTDLVKFAQAKGLVVMGYSPFGALVYRYGLDKPAPSNVISVLEKIANKYNKTNTQVVLRWLVDRNIMPVVKSINSKRQAENINIFDFKLNQEDIQNINDLNSNTRLTLPSFWQSHPYYPFEKIENPLQDPFKPSN